MKDAGGFRVGWKGGCRYVPGGVEGAERLKPCCTCSVFKGIKHEVMFSKDILNMSFPNLP